MRIALLGDIALFGKMSLKECPENIVYFKEMSNYLSCFDYVVGNLETPFSLVKKTNGAKSAYICSDIENVQILKQLHLNAVSLANNHMYDFGKEGYETTKKILNENGIEWFGTEGKELKLEKFGNKIAFSGFCCYSSNPLQCVEYGKYGVNAYNLRTVKNVISHIHEDGYLNIVSVHAGLEHVNYPSIDHIRAARMLADTLPYVYYGHHPHVIQGVEDYKGSLLAHSLGNFCFDDVYTDASDKPLITLTENNRTGLILELTIENNKIEEWKEQVIYIAKDGKIIIVNKYDELTDYNAGLAKCEADEVAYNERRIKILSSRIAERKAMRNMSWYLKRLRPRYVKLVLDCRRNAKLYKENVKYYIENGL